MQENLNIPDSTITTNLSFRQLVLMNMQQLTNFPYIEKDFDALTDYELLCLVVKFLNDVIANQNEQNDSITRLYESFLALQTYVNNTKDTLEDAFNELDNYVRNYFDNLDVQEEINNKLDDMAESGQLTDIIAQYLGLAGMIAYDTVADMKTAQNLVNGSKCRTLGFHSVNDGGGSYYKIRTVTNDDVVDEMTIIEVYDDTLVAELIIEDEMTPEQFGAYGDNTHNDTQSWQKLVDISPSVKAFPKTYLLGKVNITRNINIDCNGAKFTCSSPTLFDIKGEIDETITGENNYVANDLSYYLVNDNYSNYSGFAYIEGNNNFEQSRDYYKGGFVCSFYNGKINEAYPIPVTSPSISFINPITFTLKNISDIILTDSYNDNKLIQVTYGFNSTISNIKIKNGESFTEIYLDKCLNIELSHIDVNHDSSSNSGVNYIININDSSYTKTLNSHLHSVNWHCWTSGGKVLAFNNIVNSCEFTSDNRIGLADHSNALGTSVLNSTVSSVLLSGLSTIKNCKITTTKIDNSGRCYVRLAPISIEDNAIYNIENITFMPESTVIFPYCGITIYSSPEVQGNHYYVKELNASNCRVNGKLRASTYINTSDTGGTYTIEKVIIDNCTMDIELKRASDTQVDVTNSVLYVSNINQEMTVSSTDRKIQIGINSNDEFGSVYVSNCDLKNIIGSFINLNLNNVKCDSNISTLTISGLLSGSNIRSRINPAVIVASNDVMIDSMLYAQNTRYFNICKISGHYYCQTVDTGSFVTHEITNA